jgi:hypothetical protein
LREKYLWYDEKKLTEKWWTGSFLIT